MKNIFAIALLIFSAAFSVAQNTLREADVGDQQARHEVGRDVEWRQRLAGLGYEHSAFRHA